MTELAVRLALVALWLALSLSPEGGGYAGAWCLMLAILNWGVVSESPFNAAGSAAASLGVIALIAL